MGLNGIDIITPTSVAKTGTSSVATINSGGSVTFTTCETLSLNGVFSSTYDNYIVEIRYTSSAAVNLNARLRASGTDNSTTSSYVRQALSADGTSATGVRTTANLTLWGAPQNVQQCGATVYLFGPYLAQPTAMRTVDVNDLSSARIYDVASTHNQSTAYDGFTIYVTSSQTITGLITVYGLVK